MNCWWQQSWKGSLSPSTSALSWQHCKVRMLCIQRIPGGGVESISCNQEKAVVLIRSTRHVTDMCVGSECRTHQNYYRFVSECQMHQNYHGFVSECHTHQDYYRFVSECLMHQNYHGFVSECQTHQDYYRSVFECIFLSLPRNVCWCAGPESFESWLLLFSSHQDPPFFYQSQCLITWRARNCPDCVSEAREFPGMLPRICAIASRPVKYWIRVIR